MIRVNAKIRDLAESCFQHEALDNSFFNKWCNRHLSISELRCFARNYGEWVRSFPDALAILVASTDNPMAKVQYASILYSELGCGKLDKAHWRLLDEFFDDLSRHLGHDGALAREALEQQEPLLPATKELIECERRLYGSAEPIVACGAQLALEWQAYTMLRQLYEGARNYIDLWSKRDEFYEACEYFFVHIGEAEKKHKEESISAAQAYCTDVQSLRQLTVGFKEHLDLISQFWNGIANAAETSSSTKGCEP